MLGAERALGACSALSGPKRVFILVWANGMCGGSDPWATTGPASRCRLRWRHSSRFAMELAYRAAAAVPGFSIRALLTSLVQTQSFRFRAPSPGEM